MTVSSQAEGDSGLKLIDGYQGGQPSQGGLWKTCGPTPAVQTITSRSLGAHGSHV